MCADTATTNVSPFFAPALDVKVYKDMESVYGTNIGVMEHDLARLARLVMTFPENRLYRLLHREVEHQLVANKRQVEVLQFLQDTTLRSAYLLRCASCCLMVLARCCC